MHGTEKYVLDTFPSVLLEKRYFMILINLDGQNM